MAAQDRGILGGEAPGRLGQARLVADQRRAVAGIGDLDLGPLGEGAQAPGDRALQRLGPGSLRSPDLLRLVRAMALRIHRKRDRDSPSNMSRGDGRRGSARQLSATFNALSGNSLPKARW